MSWTVNLLTVKTMPLECCRKRQCCWDEHFRCADGIAEYFNSEFYDYGLCLCCETGRNGKSAVSGLKPGMD